MLHLAINKIGDRCSCIDCWYGNTELRKEIVVARRRYSINWDRLKLLFDLVLGAVDDLDVLLLLQLLQVIEVVVVLFCTCCACRAHGDPWLNLAEEDIDDSCIGLWLGGSVVIAVVVHHLHRFKPHSSSCHAPIFLHVVIELIVVDIALGHFSRSS